MGGFGKRARARWAEAGSRAAAALVALVCLSATGGGAEADFGPRSATPQVETLQSAAAYPNDPPPPTMSDALPTLAELRATPPLPERVPLPELLKTPPPPPSPLARRKLETLFQGAAPGKVSSIAFSQDGRLCAVATEEGFVGVWSIHRKTRLAAIQRKDRAPIRAVAFHGDHRRTTVVGGGEAWVWAPFEAAPQSLRGWTYDGLEPQAAVLFMGKPETLFVVGRARLAAPATESLLGPPAAVFHDLEAGKVEVVRPADGAAKDARPAPKSGYAPFRWALPSALPGKRRLIVHDGPQVLLAGFDGSKKFQPQRWTGPAGPIREMLFVSGANRLRLWDGKTWFGYDLELYPRSILNGWVMVNERLELPDYWAPPRMEEGVDGVEGSTMLAYDGARMTAWESNLGRKVLEAEGTPPPGERIVSRVHAWSRTAAAGGDGEFVVVRCPRAQLSLSLWRKAYRAAVERLLAEEKFDAIEAEAKGLVREPFPRERMEEWGWGFQVALSEPTAPKDPVPDREGKLRKYVAKHPKSANAKLALSTALSLKGARLERDPKDADGKLSRPVYQESEDVLQEAIDLGLEDAVGWAETLQRIRLGRVPEETLEPVLAEIRKRDPAQPHYLREMAYHLLFHEGPQAVGAFAEKAAAAVQDPDQKAEILARMVQTAMLWEDSAVPERYGCSTVAFLAASRRMENLRPDDGQWAVRTTKLHLLRGEVEPALAAYRRALVSGPRYAVRHLPSLEDLSETWSDPLVREARPILMGDGFHCYYFAGPETGWLAASGARWVMIRKDEAKPDAVELRFQGPLPELWAWAGDGKRAAAVGVRNPAWLSVLNLEDGKRTDVDVLPGARAAFFTDEADRIVLQYPKELSVLNASTLEETARHPGEFRWYMGLSDRPVLWTSSKGTVREAALDDPSKSRKLPLDKLADAAPLALSADGKQLYFYGGGRLQRADTKSYALEDLGAQPKCFVGRLSSDGRAIYLDTDGGLVRFDLETRTSKTVLPPNLCDRLLGFGPQGKSLRTAAKGAVVLSWPVDWLERRGGAEKPRKPEKQGPAKQ